MKSLKTIILTTAILSCALVFSMPSCSDVEKAADAENVKTADAENGFADYLVAYDYDRDIPLNAEVKVLREGGGHSMYDLHFDSTNGERVPARMHIPATKEPPYPAIVVQHGYGGDKEFGGLFAGLLVPRGFAVIAIDAEYHGDRKEQGKDIFSIDAADDRRALLQTVVDLRRAVDYLESRGDIDMERVGYTGASMGGILGALFTGVDERVKTSVLIVGGGDWEKLVSGSQVGAFEVIRDYCKKNGLSVADFVDDWDAVDPVNLAGHISPRPLLMINCANDKYVPKDTGEALFSAAGKPKDIRWFECAGDIAHFPPTDKTMALLTKWFKRFL